MSSNPQTKASPKPNVNLGMQGNFPRGQLPGCLPTLKLTFTLAQTLILTWGEISGAIVQIQIFLYFHSFINLANETIICVLEQILIFLIIKDRYKDQELLFKIQAIVKSYHKLQELLVFLKILKLQRIH